MSEWWSRATNVRSPYASKIDHPCTAAISRSVWLRSPRSRCRRAVAGPRGRRRRRGHGRRHAGLHHAPGLPSTLGALGGAGGGGGGGGEACPAAAAASVAAAAAAAAAALAGRRRRRRPRHHRVLRRCCASLDAAEHVHSQTRAGRTSCASRCRSETRPCSRDPRPSRPPRRRRSCRPTGSQRCPCRTARRCGRRWWPSQLRCCGAAPGRCRSRAHTPGTWSTAGAPGPRCVDDARRVTLGQPAQTGREHVQACPALFSRSGAHRCDRQSSAWRRCSRRCVESRVDAGRQCLDVRGAVSAEELALVALRCGLDGRGARVPGVHSSAGILPCRASRSRIRRGRRSRAAWGSRALFVWASSAGGGCSLHTERVWCERSRRHAGVDSFPQSTAELRMCELPKHRSPSTTPPPRGAAPPPPLRHGGLCWILVCGGLVGSVLANSSRQTRRAPG